MMAGVEGYDALARWHGGGRGRGWRCEGMARALRPWTPAPFFPERMGEESSGPRTPGKSPKCPFLTAGGAKRGGV